MFSEAIASSIDAPYEVNSSEEMMAVIEGVNDKWIERNEQNSDICQHDQSYGRISQHEKVDKKSLDGKVEQRSNDEISQYEQTHGEMSQHAQMCEEYDVIVSQCAERDDYCVGGRHGQGADYNMVQQDHMCEDVVCGQHDQRHDELSQQDHVLDERGREEDEKILSQCAKVEQKSLSVSRHGDECPEQEGLSLQEQIDIEEQEHKKQK